MIEDYKSQHKSESKKQRIYESIDIWSTQLPNKN